MRGNCLISTVLTKRGLLTHSSEIVWLLSSALYPIARLDVCKELCGQTNHFVEVPARS